VGEPVDAVVCCCCPFVFLRQSSAKGVVGCDVSDGSSNLIYFDCDQNERRRGHSRGGELDIAMLVTKVTENSRKYFRNLAYISLQVV
jgi:hypothetical protein